MNTPILLDPGPSPKSLHRFLTAMRCLQQYAWKYGAHTVDQGETAAAATTLGKLVHLGTAHHYARLRETQTGGDPDRYFTPEDAITIWVGARIEKAEWLDVHDHAQAVVAAYIEHWRPRESYRVLHVEEVFELSYPVEGPPLADGRTSIDITTRADLVVEDAARRVYVVDTKTTSRYNKVDHPRFYGMDAQFLNYRWLGTALWGARFGGVILNMVEVGDPPKFMRPPLEPAPLLFARFPQILADQQRILDLFRDREPSAWPASPSEQVCRGRYGTCPAINLCRYGSAGGPA